MTDELELNEAIDRLRTARGIMRYASGEASEVIAVQDHLTEAKNCIHRYERRFEDD